MRCWTKGTQYEYSMIYRAEPARISRQEIEFIYGDVTYPAAVEQAFDGIDACFHLAAIASVVRSSCEWRRAHEVNLTGTINIFEQARRLRDRREIPVVYASTAAVYGDCNVVPTGEQHPAAPLSAYGADKRACELHARVAGSVHRIPTVGLRFFNLYGPRQNPNSPYSGVIAIFADRLARGEPVEIFGDGQQVRDFTHVGDAVCALGPGSTGGEHQRLHIQRLHRDGNDGTGPCGDDGYLL